MGFAQLMAGKPDFFLLKICKQKARKNTQNKCYDFMKSLMHKDLST